MAHPLLIILGSAGSGKGTQASLLEEQFGYHKIEAGALFRAKSQEDSDLGRRVKEINDAGGFAPDEMISGFVREAIMKLPTTAPVLIDNFPVTVGQAQALQKAMDELGRKEKIVAIWVKVSRDEARRRLNNRSQCIACKTVYMNRDTTKCVKCGGVVKPRDYDYPEAIENRLNNFYNKTIPLLDHYRQQNQLIEINGEQPVVHVFDEIIRALGPLLRVAQAPINEN